MPTARDRLEEEIRSAYRRAETQRHYNWLRRGVNGQFPSLWILAGQITEMAIGILDELQQELALYVDWVIRYPNSVALLFAKRDLEIPGDLQYAGSWLDSLVDRVPWSDYRGATAHAERLAGAIGPVWAGAHYSGQTMQALVRPSFSVRAPVPLDWQESWIIPKVVGEVDAATHRALVRTIAEGVRRGETGQQIAERIMAIDSKMFGLVRADRIARTETLAAMRLGQWEQAVQSGAVMKLWKSRVAAPNTREWHREVHNQQQGVNEPFEVYNGSGDLELMRFPGDREFDPSPDNVINCRCGVRYYHPGESVPEQGPRPEPVKIVRPKKVPKARTVKRFVEVRANEDVSKLLGTSREIVLAPGKPRANALGDADLFTGRVRLDPHVNRMLGMMVEKDRQWGPDSLLGGAAADAVQTVIHEITHAQGPHELVEVMPRLRSLGFEEGLTTAITKLLEKGLRRKWFPTVVFGTGQVSYPAETAFVQTLARWVSRRDGRTVRQVLIGWRSLTMDGIVAELGAEIDPAGLGVIANTIEFYSKKANRFGKGDPFSDRKKGGIAVGHEFIKLLKEMAR